MNNIKQKLNHISYNISSITNIRIPSATLTLKPIIKSFIVNQSIPLKVKKEVVDLNIMYSNEDHCGVCNGYVNEVKKEIIKKEELLSNERMLNDEFIWMLGTTGDFVKKWYKMRKRKKFIVT